MSPIHTMPHLRPSDGRIPLPQLPTLPFESLTENECNAQCQSPSSLVRLLSIFPKARPSAEYNKLQTAEGRFESSDENTGASFIGHGDACDPSIATILPAQSKGVPGRAQDWFIRWFLEWWMMEILSWLFGLACMVGITVLLWSTDGKPSPEWKIGISIASLISILSGFTKSALLLPTAEALGQLKWDWLRKSETNIVNFERLDSASRGSMGSLVLLIRARKVTLASLGAAVVLLSLPLDGFFQRIASYPTITVLDTANATISRAILYDPYPEEVISGGTHKYGPDSILDSFAYPFWASQGMSSETAFNCPTSNCTFDPFHTLAVDYQCQEIFPPVEFTCQNASAEWMIATNYYDIATNAKPMPIVTSCGYYLDVPAYGKQLMSGYEITGDGTMGEVLAQRFFPLMDLSTNTQYWNGSYSLQNVSQVSLTDFIIATTPGGFSGARHNNTPVMTECEVHWVVQKIAASVTNGRLVEDLLETLQFSSELSSPWDPVDGSEFVAEFAMSLVDPHSTTGGLSTFGLDNTTAFKAFMVWSGIAPSTLNLSPKVDKDPVLRFSWFLSVPRVLIAGQESPWEAPNNVTQHIDNIIKVQNQQIRRNSNSRRGVAGQNVAVGQAWRNLQIVKVHWAWIAMPLSLLLISGIFLAATVVRSSKDKVGIYKTSALAALFSGVGDQNNVEMSEGRRGVIHARAKIIRSSRLILPSLTNSSSEAGSG